MSDYTKLTAYDLKDSLTTGDPLKRVKGTELDDEFDAIGVAIATKANSASPAFTGTPTGSTAALGTNTTQLATTAFVQTAIADNETAVAITGGTIAGVTVNGTTTTQAVNTNNTTLASTAFVQAATPYASQSVKGLVRAYVSGSTLYIFTS
jgi:predicted aconitase